MPFLGGLIKGIERFIGPQLSLPEPVSGDYLQIWNHFFGRRGLLEGGIRIPEEQHPLLLGFLLSLFSALNLSNARERISLDETTRKELMDQIEKLNKEIQDLQQRRPTSLQPRQMNLIRNTINSLLNQLGQPQPRPDLIASAIGRLADLINQAGNQALINNLTQIRENLQKTLNQSIPDNLLRLANFFLNERYYEALVGDNDLLRSRLSEGLEMLGDHLKRGGLIELSFAEEDFNRALRELGIGEINLNDQQTMDLLGISRDHQANNRYVLRVRGINIADPTVNNLDDIIRTLSREFSEQEIERRNKTIQEEIKRNEELAEKVAQENPQLAEILTIFNSILQKELDIENKWREIQQKFAFNGLESFLTGKQYDSSLRSHIVSVYYWWRQMRRVFDAAKEEINKLIRGERSDIDLDRLRELRIKLENINREMGAIQEMMKELQEAVKARNSKEVENIFGRLAKAGKNIMTIFARAGLVSAILVFPWIGAFAILPYGIIAWAWKQVESQFFTKKS